MSHYRTVPHVFFNASIKHRAINHYNAHTTAILSATPEGKKILFGAIDAIATNIGKNRATLNQLIEHYVRAHNQG